MKPSFYFKYFEKIKGVFANRTIRVELMVAMIFAALLPVTIINIYYYSRMNSFVEEKVTSYNTEILRQAGEKLDSLISQIDITKKQLVSTAITSQLFLNYSEKSAMEKLNIVRGTEDILGNVKRSFPEIADIYMIGFDGTVFSTNSNKDRNKLLEKEWIRSISRKTYGDMVIPTHNADYININDNLNQKGTFNPVISFTKKITGYADNRAIGIIQVDLKYSEVKKIMESVNLGENGFIIMADSQGKLIYCPDPEYLGRDLSEFDHNGFNTRTTNGFSTVNKPLKAFMVNSTVQSLGWRIMGVVPTENTIMEIKQVNRVTLLIAIVSILLSFFVSYLLSRGITRPITRITKTMKRVGEGNFDIVVPETNYQDLRILSDSFNIMVNRIDTLMKNVLQKEKEKTNAELKALQAQITPHFLYNTLNTIKWMALMEKSENIANAIVAVVGILEFSCKNTDKMIPIGAELDFIDKYIFIQRMRFGTSINVKYETDDSIRDLFTLKFILQPIVENAIIHGLAGKKYVGLITIRGRQEENRVVFEVEDDGSGMDLNKKEKFTGLGMGNVDTRIKLNFGDAYGLRIISNCGMGTKVIITIPRISEGEA